MPQSMHSDILFVLAGLCEGVGPEPWVGADEDSPSLSRVSRRQLHPLLQAAA